MKKINRKKFFLYAVGSSAIVMNIKSLFFQTAIAKTKKAFNIDQKIEVKINPKAVSRKTGGKNV